MRALGLIAVQLGVAAVLASSSPGPDSAAAARAERADLRIVLWPQGKQKATRPLRWRLRCGPVAGTLPRRRLACRRLLSLSRPFRGVPKGTACTEIYGGPEVAEVRGSLRGRRVAARFTRTDGCQIERWNRVRFLFPAS